MARIQVLTGGSIVDRDRLHRALLGGVENLLPRCPTRVDDDRLALLIEDECLAGDLDTHGGADASVVVDRDPEFIAHDQNLTWSDFSERPMTVGQYSYSSDTMVGTSNRSVRAAKVS